MRSTTSRVEVVPATLRDVSFIGANLRQADRGEILCQLPKGMSGSDAASLLFQGMLVDWSWVALLGGQPVACFGVSPFTTAVWLGFAFGTRDLPRAIPRISRDILDLEPRLTALGVRRVEVRTLATHDISHAWLRKIGCWFEAEMPNYGRDGETFELWAWHVGRPPSQFAKWKPRHVCRITETQDPQAAGPAAPG